MNSLTPYVVFPGTCAEALAFYAAALGGEITTQMTFAESPIDVPSDFGDRVYNAELRWGDVLLRASDDLPSHPVTLGSNISLFVTFGTREERDQAFAKLAQDGSTIFPPEGEFGMLEDRFGVRWMLVG